jgi:archaellum component FlaC
MVVVAATLTASHLWIDHRQQQLARNLASLGRALEQKQQSADAALQVRMSLLETLHSQLDNRIAKVSGEVTQPKVQELRSMIESLDSRAKEIQAAEERLTKDLERLAHRIQVETERLEQSIRLVTKHEELLERIRPTKKVGGLTIDETAAKRKPNGMFSTQ